MTGGRSDQFDGAGEPPGRLRPQAWRAAWIFGSLRPAPRPPGLKLPLGIRPLGNAPEGSANDPSGGAKDPPGANEPVGKEMPAAWRHCWIFAKSPPPGPPAGAPELAPGDGAVDVAGAVEADGEQAEMASMAASATVGRIRIRCRVTMVSAGSELGPGIG